MMILTLYQVLVQWKILILFCDHNIAAIFLVINIVIGGLHQFLERVQLVILVEPRCSL